MIEIRLTEGAGWSPSYRLSPEQAAASHGLAGLETRPLPSGEWQFRTRRQSPKIGTIRLGAGEDAIQFRITPKIPIERLMFLVEYAQQTASARWDDSEISATEEEGLVAVMARAFGRAAKRALHASVLAGYNETDTEATVVRGRIRVGDQALYGPTMGLPLAVSYDEFTLDIPENRLLLTAAHKLRQLPDLGDDVLDTLNYVERRLTGVRRIQPGDTWTPTRLNAHYHRALSLAGLVLRDSSYEMDGDSGIRADGLLISMSHLFQDFIVSALDKALRRNGGYCLPSQEHHLDEESVIRAQTDGECYAADHPDRAAAIIDAKYTVLGAKGRSGRMQQMISYCYSLGTPRGYLIYAQGPRSEPTSHTVRDIVLTEYPLELNRSPSELLKQIDALAAVIVG